MPEDAGRPSEVFGAVEGHLPGARKDVQSTTSEWMPLQQTIADVMLREVKNLPGRDGGVLTEIYRRDWGMDDGVVDQVFQRLLRPGEITGWHVHAHTTDRLFVSRGLARIVLYDARAGGRTFGKVNEFALGDPRPATLLVPPGVWHAVKNVGSCEAVLINLVDVAYSYEDPDHWRLPIDTREIPYTFD